MLRQASRQQMDNGGFPFQDLQLRQGLLGLFLGLGKAFGIIRRSNGFIGQQARDQKIADRQQFLGNFLRQLL